MFEERCGLLEKQINKIVFNTAHRIPMSLRRKTRILCKCIVHTSINELLKSII